MNSALSEWRPYPDGYPSLFVAFHDANPAIYESIVAHARELRRRGFCNIGVRFLFEHERYYPGMYLPANTPMARGDFGAYGLNNNFSPEYGRLIEAQEPDLRGFFRLRATEQERAAGDASQTCLEFD